MHVNTIVDIISWVSRWIMRRIAGIVLSFCAAAYAATSFNLSDNFSLGKNPNQVWQYGYSETNSLDPAEFRFDEYADTRGPVGFWHPKAVDQPRPGYYPYIAYNTTKQSQFGSSNGWAVRPGEIAVEASNTGVCSPMSLCLLTNDDRK